ncbi:VanZ family protein [Akkermansiaceae bacterium]|nr:VanZ family protein [Akkermansiaceae bacterium]
MPRFHDCFRSSRFWAFAFLFWFAILSVLSHGDRFQPEVTPPFPHLDKVAHFGYFFGGAGLLSAALFFKKSPHSWIKLLFIVTLTLSLIGVFDEWHQSFFETRHGNDPGDWLADTLGALTGALVFRKFHRVLL